jgi:hypothetical protein
LALPIQGAVSAWLILFFNPNRYPVLPLLRSTIAMLDFAGFDDDLERTQSLPVLTTEMQLDETLERERAALLEIVELMRQNWAQAEEIERLQRRCDAAPAPDGTPFTRPVERRVRTEEKIFEVCAALKNTLSQVLGECQTRGVTLQCGASARHSLEDSCEALEQILCAPGFQAPAFSRADDHKALSQFAPMPQGKDAAPVRTRAARRLKVVRSGASS